MSYTVAMLNVIRNSASVEYQARIPQATQDNITAIGNSLLTFPLTLNEFTSVLVEKIALTLFDSAMFTNKLAPFKKGMLPYGVAIEEIFVGIMSADSAYQKESTDLFARKKPTNIMVNYHKRNREDLYTVTIADYQVRTAFRSAEGVQSLLDELVKSMYDGCEYDEYVLMKELLGDYELSYFDYGITAITDTATAKEFMKTVRKAVLDMSFMSKLYNKNGVMRSSSLKDMVLIVNKDVISEVSVEVLAGAFNMGQVELQPKIVVVDDFGSMTDTYAILVDKSFFMVYDTLRNVESLRNGKSMYTNYFLNVGQILSLSKFKNAVRFTTAPKANV